MRIATDMITLRINNSPSYEAQASDGDFPFLRELAYLDKNPNPITSQSVSMVTTNVGVFILLNPWITYFGPARSSKVSDEKNPSDYSTVETNDIQEINSWPLN